MKIKQAWKLPIVFLVGYMFAWGTILVDRQMLIDEQRRLTEEVKQARIEMRIKSMIGNYNDEAKEMVIWNKKAIEPAEVVEK